MDSFLENYFKTQKKSLQTSAGISFWAACDAINEDHPEVASHIVQELQDQRRFLKLIASENFASLKTQLAMGNLLTDKYAEGVPAHRFYAGCDNVDAIEHKAIASLKELFGAEHAFVQPHSGADANIIAFWAILLKKVQSKEIERLGKKNLDELTPCEYEHTRKLLVNQKLLGMSLNSGGHLTHGYRHNISSKMMHSAFYDVDPETQILDYDIIRKRAQQEKPTILLAGYSAYPRLVNFAKMREIADEVGATLLVDMAHFAGLVAGKVCTGEYDPIPYAEVVTSTTHKTLRGPRGGIVLCTNEYKEYVNKGCPLAMGGPLPHVIAAKSVAFDEALRPSFSTYAQKVVENAKALAESLMEKGVKLITNGTDNHMVIIDVSPFGITGRQAELSLRKANITCNRNAIPFDKNGPWYTSGIRIGTPALTTLGMGKEEMKRIGSIIYTCLSETKPTHTRDGALSKAQSSLDKKVADKLEKEVEEMLGAFPLYPELGNIYTNKSSICL